MAARSQETTGSKTDKKENAILNELLDVIYKYEDHDEDCRIDRSPIHMAVLELPHCLIKVQNDEDVIKGVPPSKITNKLLNKATSAIMHLQDYQLKYSRSHMHHNEKNECTLLYQASLPLKQADDRYYDLRGSLRAQSKKSMKGRQPSRKQEEDAPVRGRQPLPRKKGRKMLKTDIDVLIKEIGIDQKYLSHNEGYDNLDAKDPNLGENTTNCYEQSWSLEIAKKEEQLAEKRRSLVEAETALKHAQNGAREKWKQNHDDVPDAEDETFSDFLDFYNEETASFKKKKKDWATDIKKAEAHIKELKQELNEKISELKAKLAQFYDAPKVVDPRNAAVAGHVVRSSRADAGSRKDAERRMKEIVEEVGLELDFTDATIDLVEKRYETLQQMHIMDADGVVDYERLDMKNVKTSLLKDYIVEDGEYLKFLPENDDDEYLKEDEWNINTRLVHLKHQIDIKTVVDIDYENKSYNLILDTDKLQRIQRQYTQLLTEMREKVKEFKELRRSVFPASASGKKRKSMSKSPKPKKAKADPTGDEEEEPEDTGLSPMGDD